MTFDEYQKLALTTAMYRDHGTLDLAHWALGITGEGGEIAEKVKKIIRDQTELDDDAKRLLAKEIGDVLWYLAVMADQLGVPLNEVAQMNIDKLKSRQQRDQLGGSGDER